MEKPELIYLLVNVAIFVVLAINIVRCYYKGFLLSLWECFGTVFAILIAWNIGPVVARVVRLFPLAWTPMGESILGPVINGALNRYVMILILFLAIKIGLFLLKPIVKMIQKIPVFKEINQIAGAFFGIVITWVWILGAIFVLSIPVFKEGNTIIENTALSLVGEYSLGMFNTMASTVQENETVSRIMRGEALTEEDQRVIEKWIKDYHLDDFHLDDINQ